MVLRAEVRRLPRDRLRGGDEHRLQSRGAKDLTRYFPELRFPPGHYVLDGEIVIDGDGARAPRRSARCSSASTPRPHASSGSRASCPPAYVAFDLLELDGEELLREPFERRRAALERLDGIRRSELVRDPAAAEHWLEHTEGVVAKRLDAAVRAG